MTRIVICEDNQQLCRLLERGVEQDGLKVTVTSTVRDCLDTLSREGADLVLIDILLKGENTLALIRQLRAEHRALKIVAMTGAGHALACAAMAQGADSVLEKPFLLDTLEDLVASLVPAPAAAQG
jgi:two-component system phosphate regulon response regulator OmpR